MSPPATQALTARHALAPVGCARRIRRTEECTRRDYCDRTAAVGEREEDGHEGSDEEQRRIRDRGRAEGRAGRHCVAAAPPPENDGRAERQSDGRHRRADSVVAELWRREEDVRDVDGRRGKGELPAHQAPQEKVHDCGDADHHEQVQMTPEQHEARRVVARDEGEALHEWIGEHGERLVEAGIVDERCVAEGPAPGDEDVVALAEEVHADEQARPAEDDGSAGRRDRETAEQQRHRRWAPSRPRTPVRLSRNRCAPSRSPRPMSTCVWIPSLHFVAGRGRPGSLPF